MRIWVSSLARIHDTMALTGARRVVSLLSPEDEFPQIALGAKNHHRVHLHDIVEELEGHVPPSPRHVAALIGFFEEWSPKDPLVVHCWAGISRSTAAAFVAACLHNPHADETMIAREIRAASPTALPNRRIVALADAELGRTGRMVSAIESIGPADFAIEATPFSIRARF